MESLKLFMVLIGCTPAGRNTEQHDVFFGIGTSLQALIPQMQAFWPEAQGKIHIDAWREISQVDGHIISVVPKAEAFENGSAENLYFLNLGGYKRGEFEEYHYKMLVVAPNISVAISQSKQTAFYQHAGFKGAESHIDDKYGIDVDDVHKVTDILPAVLKEQYSIYITPALERVEDEAHIGYVQLSKIKQNS